MIQAMIRGKSNLRSRYIGRNHGLHDGRRTQEDEITSLMLGVLAYQPPAVVWAIMRTWLVHLGVGKRIQLPELIDGLTCEVRFWPRSNYVEPDVVIDVFRFQKLELRVVVEAKWNAGESGEDQFKKQRQAFERDTIPSQFVHLALLKSLHDLPPSIEHGRYGVFRTTWDAYVGAVKGANSTPQINTAHLSTLVSDLEQMLMQLQLTRTFSGIDLKNACHDEAIPNSIKLFNNWSFAAIGRREYGVEIREWCFLTSA